MKIQSTLRSLRTVALIAIAGAAIFIPAQSNAAPHFGGGGFHGGVRAFGGFHGGYRGGYGYGFRGGYGYGFHRGFYGGCCWWGWPGGLFLATLPLYYSTWWWNGVPYYYANDGYYIWNGDVGQYESVTPPSAMLSRSGQPRPGSVAAVSTDLFAYPKNGQSEEQQARDRQECRDWAQTAAGSTAAPDPTANSRAQTACLEGRGYSVR
jgi:hypothetical protein